MLHTKFNGNWSTGSGEARFLKGFLGHVTQMSHTNFPSLYPWRLYIKFGIDWQNPSRANDVVKREPDNRAWVYYKFTYEPLAQVSSNIFLHRIQA